MKRKPVLNDEIRAYLRRVDRRLLLVDVVRELTGSFGLTPSDAGRAIAQAVLEDCGAPAPAKAEQQTALDLD